MTQYLLSVHHEGLEYDEDNTYGSPEEMQRAFAQVDAFNQKMQDTGRWVFGGGLEAPSTATVVDATGNSVTITDGPYGESKEHIGGFWVLEAEDLDTALKLAEEASAACMGAVQVRPFQSEPEG